MKRHLYRNKYLWLYFYNGMIFTPQGYLNSWHFQRWARPFPTTIWDKYHKVVGITACKGTSLKQTDYTNNSLWTKICHISALSTTKQTWRYIWQPHNIVLKLCNVVLSSGKIGKKLENMKKEIKKEHDHKIIKLPDHCPGIRLHRDTMSSYRILALQGKFNHFVFSPCNSRIFTRRGV